MAKRIVSLTDWLGLRDAPNWSVARFLGPLLSVVIALLFVLALIAAFAMVGRAIFSNGDVSLGLGALVAALLGAPFVIWGTVLKHQTVMFQKEGHMTDRISKAVEQLGVEKIVKDREPIQKYRKDKITGKIKRDSDGNPIKAQKVGGGDLVSFRIVEKTTANLEVRIGAILSLERIAQDSTRHDNGRDHVRVMEILSAYIRENAKIPEDYEKVQEKSVTDTQLLESISDLKPPRVDVQLLRL